MKITDSRKLFEEINNVDSQKFEDENKGVAPVSYSDAVKDSQVGRKRFKQVLDDSAKKAEDALDEKSVEAEDVDPEDRLSLSESIFESDETNLDDNVETSDENNKPVTDVSGKPAERKKRKYEKKSDNIEGMPNDLFTAVYDSLTRGATHARKKAPVNGGRYEGFAYDQEMGIQWGDVDDEGNYDIYLRVFAPTPEGLDLARQIADTFKKYGVTNFIRPVRWPISPEHAYVCMIKVPGTSIKESFKFMHSKYLREDYVGNPFANISEEEKASVRMNMVMELTRSAWDYVARLTDILKDADTLSFSEGAKAILSRVLADFSKDVGELQTLATFESPNEEDITVGADMAASTLVSSDNSEVNDVTDTAVVSEEPIIEVSDISVNV